MEDGIFPSIPEGQIFPGFVGVNALMFRPVVLKEPLDVLQQRNKIEITKEKRDLDQPIDEVKDKIFYREVSSDDLAQETGQIMGKDDKEKDSDSESNHHDGAEGPRAQLLFPLFQSLVGRKRKGLKAIDQGFNQNDRPPDEGPS